MSIDSNPDDPLMIIAAVVPILNGKDSNGNIVYLGPQTTKISRYLLVAFLAGYSEVFRLGYGKEIDKSIYFTLYGLGKVADSFKQFGPYHQPIHYDRTKGAGKVYTMISNGDLVDMRKMDGETYVKITEKGDKQSNKLLQEFKKIYKIVNMNMRTDSGSEERFVAKGVKPGVSYDYDLQKSLTDKISEINLPFRDELMTIEDD